MACAAAVPTVAMTDLPTRSGGAARIWACGLSVTVMLILIMSMIPRQGYPVQDLAGSAGWWYVARASGLLAWVLLGVAVAVGMR